MKNALEWLEATAGRFPNKIGFTDKDHESTFDEVLSGAKCIGTALSAYGMHRPVAVMMDKTCGCVKAMMGTLYAGDFYTVVDVHSPIERLDAILTVLGDPIVLTDKDNAVLAGSSKGDYTVLRYEDAVQTKIDQDSLDSIRSSMIDMDTAYILFTSGSTGVPKGTVISHRSLIAYVNWVTKEFNFSEDTVFASQTPLYFSMSVTDLYSVIKCGGTFHIVPRQLFMFPLKLVKFLNEKKVNTIYWVPTALSILANWKTFEVAKPAYLEKVLFAGEVMPTKQLNYWIWNIPNALYANLFGPTETTDICTFYVVDRTFRDYESLPIGKHCDNCHVFVVKDDGTEAKVGEEGELYARSSFVADGYYRNPEKTAAAFVQNPLNKGYPETVYRTGDLVKLNERCILQE